MTSTDWVASRLVWEHTHAHVHAVTQPPPYQIEFPLKMKGAREEAWWGNWRTLSVFHPLIEKGEKENHEILSIFLFALLALLPSSHS